MELRDSIAEIVYEFDHQNLDLMSGEELRNLYNNRADQILSHIIEYVEQVRNPYPYSAKIKDDRYVDKFLYDGAELMRQSILSLLRGEKK